MNEDSLVLLFITLPIIIFIICFIILPIVLILRVPKGKSKIQKYKGLSIFFTIVGIVFSIACLSYYANSFSREKEKETIHTPSFTIEEYKVKLDVGLDNVVDVEEQITVDFYTGSHGIIRSLPYWLEYTGSNNKTISRRYDLKDINVLEDKFETYTEDERRKIKIGDEDRIIDGTHTYIITYKYNMGNDPYKDHDEFIYHVFGDYWGTPINNASIEITMPKSFSEDNLKVFLDKYRVNDVTNRMNISYVGNKIKIRVPDTMTLGKALTVDLVLPDNYFEATKSAYGYGSLTCLIIMFVLFITIYIMWLRFGKDYKFDKSYRSGPPEGLDAASIGYINKHGTSGNKLLVATIMELANKKAITIEDTKDNLLINNSKKKVDLTSNQQIVYDGLFENNQEQVNLKELNTYKIISALDVNLQQELDEKINDLKSVKKMFKSSRFIVYASLLWLIGFAIKDLAPELHFLYIIGLILLPLFIVFTGIMGRRTEYGERLYKDVQGYKDYLSNIGEKQLLEIKDQDINICNILYAYAYVFDISNKFGNKLTETYTDKVRDHIYYNDSLITSMNRATSPSYSSSGSSSGCSSCGGGGGGGCSSCGGGSSW